MSTATPKTTANQILKYKCLATGANQDMMLLHFCCLAKT
jgi:hypothetical protein